MRNTAAKQLAQLAVKSVIGDVAVEDDIKSTNRSSATVGDSLAWAELLAVVARVCIALYLDHTLIRLLDLAVLAFKEPRHSIGSLKCTFTNILFCSSMAASVRGCEAIGRFSNRAPRLSCFLGTRADAERRLAFGLIRKGIL